MKILVSPFSGDYDDDGGGDGDDGGGEDENDVKLFHHSLVHLTSGSALRLIKEGIMLVAHIHC